MAKDPPLALADEDDGAVRLPVLLRTGVEKEVVVADAIEHLREVDRAMAEAKMAPLTAAPPKE